MAIVCEGLRTEDIYFSGVRREYRLATTRVHVVAAGADPLRVVASAKELRARYDQVWAVFDVEAAGAHALRHERLVPAIEEAQRSGIRCAISHPCFELWLLLHFRPQTAYLTNEAVRARLRDVDCGYHEKGFDFVKVWPRHPAAVENARLLDKRQREDHPRLVDRNPWTTVHELVTHLLSLIPPAGGSGPRSVG